MVAWPDEFKLNTDWSDTPIVSVVENSPEVGLPIRRLRSANIQHELTATLTVNYSEFTTVFLPFLADITYGLDSFSFISPVDSLVHEAKLKSKSGQLYTIKRKDRCSYTINVTFIYTVPM